MKAVLILIAISAVTASHAERAKLQTDSVFVQMMTGFVAGLQHDPTHMSNCQTVIPSLSTSWTKAATSIVAMDGWASLYNLRDFFSALDFWTQTCNFTTLLNYIKINITWNLLITRIFTNLTFYAVSSTQNAWSAMVADYTAGMYLDAGKQIGQLVSKTIGFNLN